MRLAEVLKFTCGQCGEVHEGLPDYAFDAPYHYYDVPEEEREQRCRLNSDLCSIDDQDYFVRAVLLVPINQTESALGWGVWSSLSAQNFKRYCELWDGKPVDDEGPYFGWLCNRLPIYPDTLHLKVRVCLQADNQRPLLELEPTDHPLAVDQRSGLSWAQAVEIAEQLLHPPE